MTIEYWFFEWYFWAYSGGNVGLNMTVTADAVCCHRRRGSNLERALAGNDLGADEDEEDEDAKA